MDDPLTSQIINAAYTVFNKLGSGFLEKVYENALAIELKKSGLCITQQQALRVFYDGQEVGVYYADIMVEHCIIVELKAVFSLLSEHEVQLVNYLTATGYDTGLLINFSNKTVQIKRKYRIYQPPNNL
jgi:GxxExxY protein